MTPWLIGVKHPKQIALCETNTIVLLIRVIILTHSFYLSTKRLSRITKTNSMWLVGKILKLWGEKAITGIAIFLSFGV